MKTIFTFCLFMLMLAAQAQSRRDTLKLTFSQEDYYVEVWTVDAVTYYGQVTCYTYEYHSSYPPRRKEKEAKYYSKTTVLDTVQAKIVYERYAASNIDSIPLTGHVLLSGGRGCLGAVYKVQSYNGSYSSTREYHDLIENSGKNKVKQIEEFLHTLYAELEISERERELFSTLPNGSYRNGGMTILTIRHKDFSVNPYWTMDNWY